MASVGIAQQDDAALRAAGFEPYETPSPFIHFIGGLWCKVEDDRAFAAVRIQDPHCNSFGSIHGGMLLALSDQLIAMSSRLLTATRSTAFLEGHWHGEDRQVMRVSGLVRLMGDADGPRRAPGLDRWGKAPEA